MKTNKEIRLGVKLNGCIVEIDLERLRSLLEKEGLMYLGKTTIELRKDYPVFKLRIWRKRIMIFLPLHGSYSWKTDTIKLYLLCTGWYYSLCKLTRRPVELKPSIIRVLAHEIDHAMRLNRIRHFSRNQIVSNFILELITLTSNLIYPISPLEIMARRFGRLKTKDQEWVKCVIIRKVQN